MLVRPTRLRTLCAANLVALLAAAVPLAACNRSQSSSGDSAFDGDAGPVELDQAVANESKAEAKGGEYEPSSLDEPPRGAEPAESEKPRPSDPPKERDRGSRGGAAKPPPRPVFVGIDDRLRTIQDHLRSIENPADRTRFRYLYLTHLANAGASDAELQAHRQALSLLVNSLSTGRRVVVPAAVDRQRLIFAIDLRDYAWDAGTWEQVVREYPYELAYDEDSRIFPFDENTAQQNRDDTGTNVPAIAGDWFLAHASLAPLYYDVLRLPRDVGQLTRDLGIDVADEIAREQVVRAGFNGEESLNNRVIERHEQPGLAGALWLSFDFSANDGDRNVFAHPLDFRNDAGSGLFNLPNGLQAYFLMDENFTRIDRADPAIVSDPGSRDHITRAGGSCMGGCHLVQGVIRTDDQLRAQAAIASPDAAAREAVLALYPGNDTLHARMDEDAERYRRAVDETGFTGEDPDALNALVRKHQDVLDLAGAAAVLGIQSGELSDAIDASIAALPPEVLVLRQRGGVIHRDTFDALFDQIANAVGIGRQITPRLAGR